MAQAMLIIGVLIGVALSATVALFSILSMDGRFGDNLQAAAAEARLRMTGRHRRSHAAVPAKNVEVDARVRGLQEEIKVMQRLAEQGRTEREAQAATIARSAEQLAVLQVAVEDRDQRIGALEASLTEDGNKRARLGEELAAALAELARAKRDARDLQTELSVAQSGAGLSSVSGEIERLRRERDELASRLGRNGGDTRTRKESLGLVL